MNPAFGETYRILSLIGQGGMSKVYLAEHLRLHTRWAVKEVAKEQAARFDFLAEANILKRLQHPMLPRIVDIFEDDRSIYIVEDYVEGITLDELLKRQRLVDEEQGLIWMKELCGALRYLHGQKPNPIIYRDMKPSNVMLQPDGALKVIDFGIAREYKQASSADTTYIGTKGYAAPEQFGAAQTDARTDIYSLGVTLYHLLTGKSPYEPPYQPVPVRSLHPKLSRGIEYILGKCVQPEPEDRYQSVDALLDDLEHIYRFDTAYKKYRNIRRGRAALLAVLLAASVSLMLLGRSMTAREREDEYAALLARASGQYTAAPDAAYAALDAAELLFPARPDSYRQRAYALYLNGGYAACAEYAAGALAAFPGDAPLLLTLASAQYELGDYPSAAENFHAGAQIGELDVDRMRDYAVCLGRLGRLAEAEAVLETLRGRGLSPDVTAYVSGELAYAGQDFAAAEAFFLDALGQTGSDLLIRRCYLSLAETYRDGAGVIAGAADREIALIDTALALPQLMGNAVLLEMQGAACYARNGGGDMARAAGCFEGVIALGVQKPYLYVNAFTAWQAVGEYAAAAGVLDRMEAAYPRDYTPHTLRATLYILQENAKAEPERDYQAAYTEYQTALGKVTSADETTQLQQLEGLVAQLEQGGWLEEVKK